MLKYPVVSTFLSEVTMAWLRKLNKIVVGGILVVVGVVGLIFALNTLWAVLPALVAVAGLFILMSDEEGVD